MRREGERGRKESYSVRVAGRGEEVVVVQGHRDLVRRREKAVAKRGTGTVNASGWPPLAHGGLGGVIGDGGSAATNADAAARAAGPPAERRTAADDRPAAGAPATTGDRRAER